MPFTMHGQDLVFTNYFPFVFVEEGIWDPYRFISANFQDLKVTYYGPVLFFIMSAANFIFIKLFEVKQISTTFKNKFNKFPYCKYCENDYCYITG